MSAPASAQPHFADYQVSDIDDKVLSFIDWGSEPKAKRFQTRLGRSVGMKANFAGHYVLLTWGCGSLCETVALVDVRSGKVHFAPFSTSIGSDFRLDSALFVDSPPYAIQEFIASKQDMQSQQLFKSRYYVWNEKDGAFRLIE
jgi:hypothetical protein